jgi:glycosyltransferase involved in cell wall biosynthesis
MRILAVATNPETGASTRFRIVQWRRRLEAAGWTLSLDAFFSPRGSRLIYQRGRLGAKAAEVAQGAWRRWRALAAAPRRADLLLVHRELYPLGRGASVRPRFAGPLVYDYDDAMFLPQREGRGLLRRLEDLDGPRRLMEASDVVLAGNAFLADYARRHARRVVLLPTCIDTERFAPRPVAAGAPARPVVGWIGSHSTTKYLHSLSRVLEAAATRAPFRLYVVGAASPVRAAGLDLHHTDWSLAREAEDFARCDVGIYPLWRDEWSEGKCGFKAIEFMACGVPVVAAAVGANRDIITDGVDGFLASTDDEWVEKLARLVRDPELRRRMGASARRAIEERFSLTAQAPVLLGALREAAAAHGLAAPAPVNPPEAEPAAAPAGAAP